MSLRFGFFGRTAAIWALNGCFSIGFWVNPIGATHSQRRKPSAATRYIPPWSLVKGGTPSGQTRSALGNRECLMCINNNGLLG